jgi:hypothetical protein
MTPIPMLEIVYNRMETHPEEFGANGKWAKILHHYRDCLTKEESESLTTALNNTRRARMNEQLMKALANESEFDDNRETIAYRRKPLRMSDSNVTLSSAGTITTQNHIDLHAEFAEKLKKKLFEDAE